MELIIHIAGESDKVRNMERLYEVFTVAAHDKILMLVCLAVIFDTTFGVLRAIKEKCFNSCVGIDGAIRKIAMLVSLIFLVVVDALVNINLIGFVPEEARAWMGVEIVGVAQFFALLYIAYEIISIFKNMALCGLPVKKVWQYVREFLGKYTDELPDTLEQDEEEKKEVKEE